MWTSDDPGPAPGSPVVTYLGRLVKNKGMDTLVQAMQIVWKSFPECRLHLAGASNRLTQQYLDAILEPLQPGQLKLVTIEQDFEDHRKPEILSACSAFALPSIDESFGISYLEAWSHRKPVIAVENSAPASFIEHEHDGLLVRLRDPQSLADALLKLLGNRQLRRRLGMNGQAKLRARFGRDQMVKKTAECYRRALLN